MLKPGDPPHRLEFCNRLINTVAKNPGFLDGLIASYEAVVSLYSDISTRKVTKCSRYGEGHPDDQMIC